MSEPATGDLDRASEHLRALASPIRLRLLYALRSPRAASEIALEAGQDRADLRADRTLNRTTILHHLEILGEAGLVARDAEGRFVVNHQMLFSTLENVRRLAEIRPFVEVDVGRTVPGREAAAHSAVARPRLALVGGPREGHAFALAGDGPWLVGRAAGADARLDFDPHVSRRHAIVHRRAGGEFEVEAAAESTNPVLVDLELVPPGARLPCASGSVLAIGATRLVLQS